MEHFAHFSPDEQVPSVQTDFCTFGHDKQTQMGIQFLSTM